MVTRFFVLRLKWIYSFYLYSISSQNDSQSAESTFQSAKFAQGLSPKCKNYTLEEIAALHVIQQEPSATHMFIDAEIGINERLRPSVHLMALMK